MPPEPPSDWLPTVERKRAAVVLGALVLVTLLVVGLLFVLLRHSGHNTDQAGIPFPTNVTASSSPAAPTTRPAAPSSTAATSSAPTTATSCAAAAAGSGTCTLTGDGGVLSALNTYRQQHGRGPVAGAVTPAALKCAANQGDSGSCPLDYYWEPVTAQSAADVLTKIAAKSDGVTFLLSPAITSVAIGWSHSGDSWQCALIANT